MNKEKLREAARLLAETRLRAEKTERVTCKLDAPHKNKGKYRRWSKRPNTASGAGMEGAIQYRAVVEAAERLPKLPLFDGQEGENPSR